jgi:hypothetical protein
MPERSPIVRASLLLLALLQFSAPSAAALADARIGQATGPVHIESHSTSSCVHVHPEDCVFHRFLSTPLARQAARLWRIRDTRGIRWLRSTREVVRAVLRTVLPESRAPPTLS